VHSVCFLFLFLLFPPAVIRPVPFRRLSSVSPPRQSNIRVFISLFIIIHHETIRHSPFLRTLHGCMVNPDECISRSSCLCPEGEPSDVKTCGTSPEKNPDTPSARMKFFPVPVDSHLCSTLKFHPRHCFRICRHALPGNPPFAFFMPVNDSCLSSFSSVFPHHIPSPAVVCSQGEAPRPSSHPLTSPAPTSHLHPPGRSLRPWRHLMMKTFILHSDKPLKVLPVRKSDDYSSQR
jgi:hypothetical protein